jgi:hypothetical protein
VERVVCYTSGSSLVIGVRYSLVAIEQLEPLFVAVEKAILATQKASQAVWDGHWSEAPKMAVWELSSQASAILVQVHRNTPDYL